MNRSGFADLPLHGGRVPTWLATRMTAEPTRHPLPISRACPRCAGDILAALRVPHGWRTEQGTEVSGTTEILLCARCGRVTTILVADGRIVRAWPSRSAGHAA